MNMERLSAGVDLLLDACCRGGKTDEAVAKVGPRFRVAERGSDEEKFRL